MSKIVDWPHHNAVMMIKGKEDENLQICPLGDWASLALASLEVPDRSGVDWPSGHCWELGCCNNNLLASAECLDPEVAWLD